MAVYSRSIHRVCGSPSRRSSATWLLGVRRHGGSVQRPVASPLSPACESQPRGTKIIIWLKWQESGVENRPLASKSRQVKRRRRVEIAADSCMIIMVISQYDSSTRKRVARRHHRAIDEARINVINGRSASVTKW